jgi:nitroreductase
MTDKADRLIPEIPARQSVRRFDSRPVERDKIQLCLEAARLAPSAENSQPWRFVVLDDHDLIQNFSSHAFSGIYSPTRWAANAPVLIVILAELDFLTNKAGRFITGMPYYLIDIGIAGEHLVLQAEKLGLGTCWIGWFEMKKVHKSLKLPKRIRVCGVIAMGYPHPDVKKRPKKRKSLEEIVGWNGWGKSRSNNRKNSKHAR